MSDSPEYSQSREEATVVSEAPDYCLRPELEFEERIKKVFGPGTTVERAVGSEEKLTDYDSQMRFRVTTPDGTRSLIVAFAETAPSEEAECKYTFSYPVGARPSAWVSTLEELKLTVNSPFVSPEELRADHKRRREAMVNGGAHRRAEHIRLHGLMKSHAEAGSWDKVEIDYEALVYLSGPRIGEGEILSYSDHAFGALAAEAGGNIKDFKARLKSLEDIDPGSSRLKAMQERLESYGSIKLQATKESVLSFIPGSGDSLTETQYAALHYAQRQIQETGKFDGMLPIGSYRLNGKTYSVERAPNKK